MRAHSTWLMGIGLLVLACGGNKPAPEAPSGADVPAAEPPDAPAAEAPADNDGGDAAEAEPAKTDSGASSGPTMTRSARDIVTAPDTLFMFSFNESDVMQKAEAACQEKSKGDPKKNADCMTKEKAKIEIDGVGFKEEKGTWYFSTIRRKGKVLVTLNKVPFEFAKEEPNRVVLKITGRDTGTRPKKFANELTIEVPNDYQIVLNDPEHGRMVYEAKIGLLAGK